MSRWLALAVVLVVLAPAGSARAAGALERHAPVVVHASGEPDPLTSVRAFGGRVPGVRRTDRPRPTVYGRRAGRWLQYWLFFAADSQTREPFGTGRHEGDWELVMVRLRGGRPVRAVFSQHAGAESCGRRTLALVRGRPVVHLARGSHAAYFVPGLRDRTWPVPNDEADGRGLRLRPRVMRVTASSPAWMRWPGRWGGSRAGAAPGARHSPRGPAFQGVRWSDPPAWAAAARPCTRRECDERGECDGRETSWAALAAGIGLFGAGLASRRRLRRGPGI